MPKFVKDLDYVLINKKSYFNKSTRLVIKEAGHVMHDIDLSEVRLDANAESAKYEKDGAFDLLAWVNEQVLKQKVRWADSSGWGQIGAKSKIGYQIAVKEAA